MATRRKLDIGKMTDAELESAVLAYKDAKESEKAVKKAVSDYGTQIKEGLQNRNETEFIAGDIRAYITVTENSEVNELQAIEILRKALTPEQPPPTSRLTSPCPHRTDPVLPQDTRKEAESAPRKATA